MPKPNFRQRWRSPRGKGRHTYHETDLLHWEESMRVVKLLCILLLFSALGLAQTLERGAIHGTIYDTSHAVIPNAKVTLTNPSTGIRRSLVTGPGGLYDFESVAPGEYTITSEAPGF